MLLAFWFIGILTGILGIKLYEQLKAKTLTWKWYHWVITGVWYLMLIFIAGFIATSFAEGEPRAAGMATLIFGGTVLVISVLLYRFLYVKTSRPVFTKKSIKT